MSRSDENCIVKGSYRSIQENELNELLRLYSHLNLNDEIYENPLEYTSVWKEIVNNPRILYFVAELNEELIATNVEDELF